MTVVYVLIALLILGFIVTSHELGHFLVGRACGIGVVEFSVGFGPKIAQWHGKKTMYSIRCIPLGGYCRFVGEDENNAAPDSMNNQPVWKRFLTVLAGPVMNFVLGIVLTVVLFLAFGITTTMPVVGSVVEDMPAMESGLMAGDVLKEIDGKAIDYTENGTAQATAALQACDREAPVPITVLRDGQEVSLEVPLKLAEDGRYQIGIYFGYDTVHFSFGRTVDYSMRYIRMVMTEMLKALRNLVFRGEGLNDMSGPVGIVAVMSEEISSGLDTVISLIIIISLNLGIMNLLPLPALDGGRLIFLLLEAIRRKPVAPEKEGMVHLIGMALLVALLLAVTYKDIVRLL